MIYFNFTLVLTLLYLFKQIFSKNTIQRDLFYLKLGFITHNIITINLPLQFNYELLILVIVLIFEFFETIEIFCFVHNLVQVWLHA